MKTLVKPWLVCERCHKKATTKRVDLPTCGKSFHAATFLVKGGIDDPCDICTITGLNHAAIDWCMVEEMREREIWGAPEFAPLYHPVFCCVCCASIVQAPCISCTLAGRTPNYRIRSY